MLLRTLVHYGLHFLFPILIALLWPKRRWLTVYLLLLGTMAIDVDHLLARPIFDPNRCSVGTHLLHSYPMIVIYVLLLFLPYRRLAMVDTGRRRGTGAPHHHRLAGLLPLASLIPIGYSKPRQVTSMRYLPGLTI